MLETLNIWFVIIAWILNFRETNTSLQIKSEKLNNSSNVTQGLWSQIPSNMFWAISRARCVTSLDYEQISCSQAMLMYLSVNTYLFICHRQVLRQSLLNLGECVLARCVCRCACICVCYRVCVFMCVRAVVRRGSQYSSAIHTVFGVCILIACF